MVTELGTTAKHTKLVPLNLKDLYIDKVRIRVQAFSQ